MNNQYQGASMYQDKEQALKAYGAGFGSGDIAPPKEIGVESNLTRAILRMIEVADRLGSISDRVSGAGQEAKPCPPPNNSMFPITTAPTILHDAADRMNRILNDLERKLFA